MNGLITWKENEIKLREWMIQYLSDEVKSFLREQNKAWEIERIDAPCLLDIALLNKSYEIKDVWSFEADELCLRPETTPSTYLHMKEQLLSHSGIRLPYCAWQAGKSFRREQDKTLKNMRLKEFYQMEFQCAYSETTANDYHSNSLEFIRKAIENVTHLKARIVESDRLPSYSLLTMDIEIEIDDRWMEVCSISKRTDFPMTLQGVKEQKILVLEIALGLDRLVYCWSKK